MDSILKLIPGTEGLIIEALDGTRFISGVKIFKNHTTLRFNDFNLNKPGDKTGEISVGVYEMTIDASLSQIFESLDDSLDRLVMTQDQIISFCEKYSGWLRQNEYYTFFLIKERDVFFVVFVFVKANGLYANVGFLNSDHNLSSRNRHRIVVPK